MTPATQMPSEPDIKCMFKDEAFGALKDYASALRAHAESLQAEVERLRGKNGIFESALQKQVTELNERRHLIEQAERQRDAAVALLRAVPDDVTCNDVDGKNWFDLRDEVTK